VGFLKGGMKICCRGRHFLFQTEKAHCQFFNIIALVIPCGYLAGTFRVSQENNLIKSSNIDWLYPTGNTSGFTDAGEPALARP